MDLRAITPGPGAAAGYAADALLVLLVGEGLPAGLEPALAKLAQAALDSGDLALKPGRCLYLHGPAGVKAPRVVLAAAGALAHGRAQRAALAAGLAHCKAPGVKHLAVCVAGAAPDATALAAAVADASYLYRHTKPGAPAAPALARVSLLCADKVQAQAAGASLATGTAVAAGVRLARELANRPGNHCTPSDLAAQARQLAREHGLKVDVLDRKDCEKLGMGAFLAVAQGSAEPPRFIVLRYQGAAKAEPPVVLVGKGITFDTGGISIKPAAGMDEMKFDMGGAASVLGTLRAVAELKPALNVVGLVPACENMPGGRAVKPGDVVTSMAGTTIEILNTDAEGRLILCDALAYARRFNPALVVDVATLTGACVVALGHHRTGLFTPDDALAQALLAAGEQALDPAWRMPVDDEYDDALKSNFADMANVGPREGGAITAAMFLKRFTSAYRWAHLDIAGSAWKTGAAKGATGRPVGLLTHFVLGQAQAAAQPARKPRAR